MAGKIEAITVWKDGSWLAHSKGDAYYAALDDPKFLVQIDLDKLDGPKEEKPVVEPVPLPATLEEALQALDKMIPASDVDELKESMHGLNPADQEKKFLAKIHHFLGRWMRNNWGLWGGSKLRDALVGLGLEHADDMSSVILTSFLRRQFGRPLDVEGQVEHYKAYWEEQRERVGDGT